MTTIGVYVGVLAVACIGIGGVVDAQSSANASNSVSSSATSLGTVSHANPPPIVHGDSTTVNRGNATIVFAPASANKSDNAKFQTWQEFASIHPEIVKAIEYRPAVVNDPTFLHKYPALATFYEQHPDVRDALIADPGNFEAIPPRPGE